MFPASCPPLVPCYVFPFPPQGPLGRVPLLLWYNEKIRLAAARPASLRCLRLAVPCSRSLFAPSATSATAAGLGLFSGCPPLSRTETTASPRFLGNPPVYMPRALRPRRDLGAWLILSALRCCLPPTSLRRLSQSQLSRLNHAACTLPVYASQRGLLRYHATLGSGWSPAFAGQDASCWVPLEGFCSRLLRFPSSFSRLCLAHDVIGYPPPVEPPFTSQSYNSTLPASPGYLWGLIAKLATTVRSVLDTTSSSDPSALK